MIIFNKDIKLNKGEFLEGTKIKVNITENELPHAMLNIDKDTHELSIDRTNNRKDTDRIFVITDLTTDNPVRCSEAFTTKIYRNIEVIRKYHHCKTITGTEYVGGVYVFEMMPNSALITINQSNEYYSVFVDENNLIEMDEMSNPEDNKELVECMMRDAISIIK